jgi:uncharacterized protein
VGANAELVGQAYAAFGRGDIPGILDLLDDHVDWSSPQALPQGGEFTGKEGVLKFFESVGAAWDPLTVEAETVTEFGPDRVIGLVQAKGTLRGGQAVDYGAAHIFTVHGGRITRFREYVDLDRPITP